MTKQSIPRNQWIDLSDSDDDVPPPSTPLPARQTTTSHVSKPASTPHTPHYKLPRRVPPFEVKKATFDSQRPLRPRSPSFIPDSEPDLDDIPSSPESSHRGGRRVSCCSTTVVQETEYESEQESRPAPTAAEKGKGKAPAEKVWLYLSSDSEDDDDAVVRKPTGPQTSSTALETGAQNLTKENTPNLNVTPRQNTAILDLSDSDDHVDEPTPHTKPAPRHRPLPKVAFVDSDSDEMAGVLTYVPPPRSAKRPTPLRDRVNVPLDLNASDGSSSSSDSPSSSTAPPALATKPRAQPLYKTLAKSIAAPPLVSKAQLLTRSQREVIPLAWIQELDRTVFHRFGGLPEGLKVSWSNRLLNTAGRASLSKGVASIELATKVCDTEHKLRQTLAHECCHVAAWLLSKEMKPSHGPAFKLWGRRVMEAFPDISITTTHTYTINFKYRWQCSNSTCSRIFSRHSKSINPLTHGCPCGGSLFALSKDGSIRPSDSSHSTPSKTPSKPNPYLAFVVEMSPVVKASSPGMKQSDVVKAVAELWREKKKRLLDSEKGRQVEPGAERLEDAMGRLGI